LAGIGLSPIVALLGFSVLVGLSNVMSGYTIKAINSFRSGDRSTFMEDLSWLFFLIALVAAGLDLALAIAYIPGDILLIVATLVMIVFTQGKSIISKLIGSLGKIYNLIGFGADLLSFTRLIAVGLTGSIVASVINLLAALIFNSIPVFGLNYAIAGLILIAGHLFNFVISLFGAYINPLRLHYVEYLPKFYEGKGRNLSLAGTELKYIELSI
jgi:V/A-type H+-transporting ATPase subunit I